MEKTNKTRKDWRDSKITEVLSYVLCGAIVFGSYKTYKYLDVKADQEFEAKYGNLRGKSEEYQKAVIYTTVNNEMGWWNSNQSTRNWVCRLYYDKLQERE